MSVRVTTGVTPDGLAVARKRSASDADSIRLRHEAAALAAARHPGVVELVAAGPTDDGGFEVVTAFVGAHSLETAGPLPPDQAAGTVAALAETVADLHDLGVCHGRIEPSHVLLGAGGRPVLCGFGSSGPVGQSSPASDVGGLGELLRTLVLDPGAADVEPIPERRWSLARLRRWTGYDRRALLTLADHATDDDELRRPSARRFAAALREAAPAARLVQPGTSDPRQPLSRRAAGVVAAMVGLGLLIYALTNLGGSGRPSLPSAEAAPAPRPTASACPASAAPPMVTAGGTTYAIGQPCDRVTMADWDCDGVATPALLRPSTGEVFIFTGWAQPGADVAVTPTTRIDGAVDLISKTTDTCPVAVALLADGTRVEVEP